MRRKEERKCFVWGELKGADEVLDSGSRQLLACCQDVLTEPMREGRDKIKAVDVGATTVLSWCINMRVHESGRYEEFLGCTRPLSFKGSIL